LELIIGKSINSTFLVTKEFLVFSKGREREEVEVGGLLKV